MTGASLIVPAAGAGTRLGAKCPKLLAPVAHVPMLDRVLDLHARYVSRAVVVVAPSTDERVRSHVARRSHVEVVVQPQPTGMLDAIMLALPAATARPVRNVWITWCDQVAIHHDTIAMLARMCERRTDAAVILPTLETSQPYIHFDRDAEGRIVRVLQRREGDVMPGSGETDVGLFALSFAAAARLLPAYARAEEVGKATGERNFLPFIPWVARHETVLTFPTAHPMDALGVNTPDDLRRVESYLESLAG